MKHCHRRPVIASVIAAIATVLVLAITAATAPGKPLKSRATLTVVDANGVKVGEVLSLTPEDEAVVAFEIDQQAFVLLAASHGLSGTSFGPFFASSDCSGPPLFSIDDVFGLLPPTVVSAPGRTVYLAKPDATPQSFAPSTVMQLESDGSCQQHFDGVLAVEARPVIDLDTLFVPPFSVR